MKWTISLPILAIGLLMAAPCAADATDAFNRRQADTYYNMSKGGYTSATEKYGSAFEGMPDSEKASLCDKIRSALIYNRKNMIAENIFRQNVLKSQIANLEKYRSDLGCPAGK